MLTAPATHGNATRTFGHQAPVLTISTTPTIPTIDLTAFAATHGCNPRKPATLDPAIDAAHACTRAVPCETANYAYASQRCNACFARWLAEFDRASEARAVARMDAGLEGAQIIDGEEYSWFEPSADDLAELRVEYDHDGFLSDDERDLIAHSWTPGEWADEFLDPERELAEMMLERDAVREMEGW